MHCYLLISIRQNCFISFTAMKKNYYWFPVTTISLLLAFRIFSFYDSYTRIKAYNAEHTISNAFSFYASFLIAGIGGIVLLIVYLLSYFFIRNKNIDRFYSKLHIAACLIGFFILPVVAPAVGFSLYEMNRGSQGASEFYRVFMNIIYYSTLLFFLLSIFIFIIMIRKSRGSYLDDEEVIKDEEKGFLDEIDLTENNS